MEFDRRQLPATAESRIRAIDDALKLAGTAAGRNLAFKLADTDAGQALARDLADTDAEQALATGTVLLVANVLFMSMSAGGIAGAGALIVFVAGVATQTEEATDDPLQTAASDLAFVDWVDHADSGALRGDLERLIGWASIVLETEEFENPLLEEQIQRDRNFLRDELASGPDLNAAVIVPLAQRMEAALVSTLPADEPGRELVEELAGTPAEDPRDPEYAAEQAGLIADALEATGEDPPDGEKSWRDWLAVRLGWAKRTAGNVGPDTAAAGGGFLGGAEVAQLLGLAGGPAAIVIGAVVSVLAVVFRRATANATASEDADRSEESNPV